MPNSNVIARAVGAGSPAQGGLVIPSLLLTTNTETLFSSQAGGPIVLAPFPPGQPLGASGFASGYDGFPFKVRAAFKAANTVASSTAIISMYVNQVGTTITAGNKVGTVTSQSLGATGTAAGVLECYCVWDSVSLVIGGFQQGFFGSGSVVAPVAFTGAATIAVAALANLNFSLTATCGTTAKSVTFTVTEFVIETV